MELQKLKLVCFSPTGTTKTVVQSIAKSINSNLSELINITTPESRKNSIYTAEDELLVVAVPVYMGRVPAVVSGWLQTIKAKDTPTVCVVVYGNRAYDNALLELKDILVQCGCKPIAGAAFIGEHSFSSPELPSSVGRPDTKDIQQAELFGQRIKELLQAVASVRQIECADIPGSYPYGGVTDLWHVDFIVVSNLCSQCGVCARGCPVGAIDSMQSSVIDKEKCTLCCACIKHCPRNARTMKPGLMKDAAIRCTTFKERKEPECFLP